MMSLRVMLGSAARRNVAAAGGLAAALTLTSVPPAAAAPARGPAGLARAVHGLDVSSYQHVPGDRVNWRLVARTGQRFTAIKVAEGTYYVNGYYRADVAAAERAGLATLPYTFANPARASGPATAGYAVRAAGRGRLPLVVDLEDDPYKAGYNCYGLKARAMIKWIAGFVARAEKLTRRVPVIYTSAGWWKQCTADSKRFNRDPLWLAAYKGTPPTPPPAWRAWTFLQYTNKGKLPGLKSVDLDFYRPTPALPALGPPARPPAKRKARPRPKPARKTQPSPVRALKRQGGLAR